eukprot:m.91263 g.91263  ORF g.91263 m.91263 type:complete len:189 (-) comp18211_c0_seq2:91-657(-)
MLLAGLLQCAPLGRVEKLSWAFEDCAAQCKFSFFRVLPGSSPFFLLQLYIYPDAPRSAPTINTASNRSSSDGGSLGGFFSKPFCANSDGSKVGDSGWGEEYSNNTCIMYGGNVYDFGSCNLQQRTQLVPRTAANHFHLSNPADWRYQCGSVSWTLQDAQKNGADVGSTVDSAPTLQQLQQWIKDVLLF